MKEKYKCNHCGIEIECRDENLDACGFISITSEKLNGSFLNYTDTPRKYYCYDCCKHIAMEFLREL